MAKDMDRLDQQQRSAEEKNRNEEEPGKMKEENEGGLKGDAPRLVPTGQTEMSGAGQTGDENEGQEQKGLDRERNTTSVEKEEEKST